MPRGSRILDLGCGNGSFIANFRQRGWQLHGFDSSESGIEIAKANFDGIHFFSADVTKESPDFFIEQCGGPVDVVLSTEVIEHVYAPRSFARLCYAALKPGGFAIITTPYHGYLKNLALALAGKMDFHYTALLDGGHIKFWSKKTLRTLLEETGFTSIHFEGSGRVPYLWMSMAAVATRPQSDSK